MEEKLKALALRYEDLEAQLADPAVYTDAEKLKRVNQELKELAPVAQAAQAWQRVTQARAEAEALLHDPDFRELAQGGVGAGQGGTGAASGADSVAAAA